MPDAPAADPVARINALTTNARNTWFVLLGALVFVGITLMGVEHIDFYGVNRATKLPLVDVEVPTRLFFIAAPILIAALYGYFHLYLIRLWDALGSAHARINRQPLGDIVAPWLITDMALYNRDWFRKDDCRTPRALDFVTMSLNTALAWVLGPCVLGLLFFQSWPARSLLISGIAGAILVAALCIGAISMMVMTRRMKGRHNDSRLTMRERVDYAVMGLGGLAIAALVAFLVFLNTTPRGADFAMKLNEDRLERTADTSQNELLIELRPRLDLSGDAVVERPTGWLPYPIARRDFLFEWCRREGIAVCEDLGNRQASFDEEWNVRRSAAIAALRKPSLNPVDPFGYVEHSPEDRVALRRRTLDLRDARMRATFLTGANLIGAGLQNADLSAAWLESALLIEADLRGANLFEASMQMADLRWADMKGARLWRTNLDGADLSGARMQGTSLREAHLHGTMLHAAQMSGAFLRLANLNRAVLAGADLREAGFQLAILEETDFSGARLERANFFGAKMQGAVLDRAELSGTNFTGADMRNVSMRDARMRGAVLVGAKMVGLHAGGTDFSGARLDFGLLADLRDRGPASLRSVTAHGTAMRQVDLRSARFDEKTDLRNSFVDGSVQFPRDLRRHVGTPCQWVDRILGDAEFHARWRGWVEANAPDWLGGWSYVAPEGWANVPPVSPPEGCAWKTGPMPGAEP